MDAFLTQFDAPGGEAGDTAGLTWIVNVWAFVSRGSAIQYWLVAADRVNVYFPAIAGVPEKTPLKAFRLSPGGNTPCMTLMPAEHPKVGVQEVANVKLKAVP